MSAQYEKLLNCYEYYRSVTDFEPRVGLILGSGLGGYARNMKVVKEIPYGDIPGFPVSTVQGHDGRFLLGYIGNVPAVVMKGRVHYYEGYSMEEVVMPVRLMKMMGIEILFLTNAAGCVNTFWQPGDLMIITDHIKLMGDSPLRGQNPDELGPRFFDMSSVWDAQARETALAAAQKCAVNVRQGVYMLFGGPQFETPAEVRLARILGADAVGMSTVPEAIAASHMGMKTLGISCLTNMGAGILDQKLNHEEVLETGERVKASFTALVREIVRTWI